MKIVSLNVWGGQKLEDLLRFLKSLQDVDVFCFQEMFSCPYLNGKGSLSGSELNSSLFSRISLALTNYFGYFSATADLIGTVNGAWTDGAGSRDCPVSVGNAIFVRNDLRLHLYGDFFVYGNRNSKDQGLTPFSPKALQYITVRDFDYANKFSIFNFHGLWNGGGKKDCLERLDQSSKIRDFLRNFTGRKILCGDFNLDPETESVKILEDDGKMINLISKFCISSTRTKLYRHYEDGSLFADYCFISPDIYVEDFFVDKAEVSDHSPLCLSCK